ncbi:SDR family NAD(P)-dependent oxidoreductase [Nakamurella leprariae]|uniref:SDR family oxidoreductase n=1 Tax=Nakamurella leprariae TaxID=2803911 RepID=A0A938YBZ0_9ACTN|nr:SDR family NAD(P)-dependent oxidoreductase [Nakamurella leprariae]MBM9467822.1 SDR family oxidoreductase [Nakamurella leprariae]
MGKLDDKVALVTGAGRGIGRAIALKLAAEGARVVANDLDEAPLQEVLTEITAAGGAAVGVPGSVTQDGFADRFVRTAVDRFGGIDIIINNAGFTWDNVIQKISDEQWHAIVDLHLKAPFDILRAAQPHISAAAKQEQRQGRTVHRKVVNISSVAGLHGNAGQANYASAKAGVVGLTKTLAKEWGRYNVNVNCVAFGFIQTRLTAVTAEQDGTIEVEGRNIKVGINPAFLKAVEQMVPLGRAGTAEEAAGSVVMLTYPEADYVSGQVIVTGGGIEG